jgi:transcriptional regulator with XRE-family HTH domain
VNDSWSLGCRLRALRNERQLTQRELAKRAGLSPNAISLIEREEISPSVATLQSLATALNVRMSYFFDVEAETNVLHVKMSDRPAISSQGITIEAAGKHLRGQQMEPFLVTLAAQPGGPCERVVHAGHELVYCLRGQVQYEVDRAVYRLEAGDFLLFEAELPHCWGNAAHEEAQLLLVLQNPSGPEESVRRHFLSYPSLTHIK